MQVGINDDNQEVCNMDGCTAIDPLSTRCTNCHRIFCARHISSSAHHCVGVTNAMVATCPICNRVVPMEFPGQLPDEAVSRHIDRRCKDVLGASRSAAATASAAQAGLQWQQRPAAGAGRRLGGANDGRRLANGADGVWCAVPSCNNAHSKAKQVICDQCGKGFCIEHRSPAQHRCQGKSEAKTVSAPTDHAVSRTPPILAKTTTDVATLLKSPSNTRTTALGRATERDEDMVVPLVCFVVPVGHTESPTPAAGAPTPLALAPVAPFFLNVPKNVVLGKVLDHAVNEASRLYAAVRTSPPSPWQMYVITLPVPEGAADSPGVYPPMPLSTSVAKSPLATTRNAVVVISPFPQLPQELVRTVADAWPTAKWNADKGKDSCRSM